MADAADRPWVPKFHTLRDEAVAAVIRCLGPIRSGPDTPPLSEHPAVFLRDSMTYRAESVGYHIDLLKRHFARFTERAHSLIGDSHARVDFLHQTRSILTFLSDDILFNAISMLDYAGNLVGFAHGGATCQRLKWNGAVKSALDKNNRLANTRSGQAMVALHREWVDRLQAVRSKIIHERIALGDGGQTMTFKADAIQVVLSFDLPSVVVKRLPFLGPLRNEKGKVDIVSGAEQIGLHAIDAATVVMSALLSDFGGRPTPTK
jgi:hypothetical protein